MAVRSVGDPLTTQRFQIWVISPFQINARANEPQTTRRKLALLTASPLGRFVSRWEQLPG
jgi:hypothetical protein